MKMLKIAFLIFVGALTLIQFIRPEKNISQQDASADITKVYPVPAEVASLLKTACYDCHSNHTQYPWYARVQPVGWILAQHIKAGKAELNFNEFSTYPVKRQRSKLISIRSQIKENEMPLASYRQMHAAARLTAAQKAMIIDWIDKQLADLQ